MKIACIQLTSGADMPANIEKLSRLVAAAASGGAEFIASPENIFFMEDPQKQRLLYTEAEHPGVLAASGLAKTHGIWFLAGSAAIKVDESGKAVNRSILFTPTGKIAARYDKIHLFDVDVGDGQTYRESAKIIPGDKAVMASIDKATVGLSICYDVRFPHLYRALAKKGAQILTVPAAFTQVTGEAHWHVLLRARAIENGCFVIAPAQTGTHPGNRKTYGHSLVIDPWGKVISDGGTEEGVVMAEIDLGEVEKVRKKLPSLEHDRSYT